MTRQAGASWRCRRHAWHEPCNPPCLLTVSPHCVISSLHPGAPHMRLNLSPRASTLAHRRRPSLKAAAALAALLCAAAAQAAPVEPAYQLSQQEKPALIATLKDLVSIESGSKDIEGLDRIATLSRDRLAAMGGDAQLIEPTEVYRMEDTPKQVGKMVMA